MNPETGNDFRLACNHALDPLPGESNRRQRDAFLRVELLFKNVDFGYRNWEIAMSR